MFERVLLDACVLAPFPLYDTLLRLADAGLVTALWSPRILAETERTLVSDLGRTPAEATRRIAQLRLSDAPAVGLTKDQVYARVANGSLERVGRGVFVNPDEVDAGLASLAAATALQPGATLCLTSALVQHGLSDMIPFTTNIALPRGTRHPAGFEHVTWHSFATDTFEVGRTLLETVGGIDVFTYSPERTIIDSFRLAHREGSDVAVEALKRWLRAGGQPSNLLIMARSFPRTETRVRQTLEILL
jgi:hypothetical protein